MTDFQSLLEGLSNRIKGLFYSSWAIAFVAVNWKAVLVIFYVGGNMDAERRIEWVTSHYDQLECSGWLLIWKPFCLALTASLLVPFLLAALEGVRYYAGVLQFNINLKLDELKKPERAELMGWKTKAGEQEKKILELEREQDHQVKYHDQLANERTIYDEDRIRLGLFLVQQNLVIQQDLRTITGQRGIARLGQLQNQSHVVGLGLVVMESNAFRITPLGQKVWDRYQETQNP